MSGSGLRAVEFVRNCPKRITAQDVGVAVTYLIADSVSLVRTVLDRVVALGDTVVEFCAADHFD